MSVHLREARHLVRLAAPMAVTQVALMFLGVIDTLMVGHLGRAAIGAASLGSLWVWGTLLVGMGVVMGIDPIVSQAYGAQDGPRCGRALQTALWLSLLLSLPIALFWLFTAPVLIRLGQSPALAEQAAAFTRAQIPSIPFFLGFTALRQYLQGREITAPAAGVAIAAIGVNVGFNWLFIYGNATLGLPALGVVGSGLATGLTRIFTFLGLLLWVIAARLHEGAWTRWTRAALGGRALLEILRPGGPVALQFSLEVWAFQIGTLFAGRLGEVDLAAHTIVLNAASFSFMLPLGVSLGAVTRVGNLVGAHKRRLAQLVAELALGLGAAVMVLSGVLFLLLREALPRLYTDDSEIVARAALVFPIAAAFQLFDGTQVVGGGILRGMGDTRPAAVFNLVGYYVLGLPLAYLLAFRTPLGLRGVWWGFCLGLFAVATSLVVWVRRRGPKRRVRALVEPLPQLDPR